jgi:hypothetical protein
MQDLAGTVIIAAVKAFIFRSWLQILGVELAVMVGVKRSVIRLIFAECSLAQDDSGYIDIAKDPIVGGARVKYEGYTLAKLK